MVDPPAVVETTTARRALATLLVVGVVVAVRYGARRWQRSDGAAERSTATVALSAGVTLTTAAGIVAVVLL
ncbi:MAG: hypothetical protein ABEH58_02310 [Haloplanus sp.]